MNSERRTEVGDAADREGRRGLGPAAPPPRSPDCYTHPSSLTSLGRYTSQVEPLPSDVAQLVRVVQGLVVHQYLASAYKVTLPESRLGEAHIRPVERMLEKILALDPQPLSARRSPDKRLAGICHHFSCLIVAFLRAKGVPARTRAGFGAYFNPPYFEEHIIGEYWNAAQGRWILVDALFDEVWRSDPKIKHDVMDVPRDLFLVAGDAWTRCRAGQADPGKFGIFVGDLRGLWFIAAELIRDVAALNQMEMLPWDTWGAMPRPNEALSDEQLRFFDHLAALSRVPDASFDELRTLYQEDQRVRVPEVVLNAVLNRSEAV